MWKYSSCKCNVKWPPTKGMCSWRLGGELGAKRKAQAETDIGGMERTENIDGGFKCAFCCSCYVGDGRSCSTCRQAPVCGTGGLAVWLRLQYPVVRETKSCIFGWQQLMDCSCWDKHSIQQGLRNLNTCKKRGFLIIAELSRSFDPRLPVCHRSRILLTHAEMLFCRHERQVEIFGTNLLFGDFYKATAATFNGANSHVCPPCPWWYPCFQNKKKNESTITYLCTRSSLWQLLAAASWEAVFVLDKCCFVTVMVFL